MKKMSIFHRLGGCTLEIFKQLYKRGKVSSIRSFQRNYFDRHQGGSTLCVYNHNIHYTCYKYNVQVFNSPNCIHDGGTQNNIQLVIHYKTLLYTMYCCLV